MTQTETTIETETRQRRDEAEEGRLVEGRRVDVEGVEKMLEIREPSIDLGIGVETKSAREKGKDSDNESFFSETGGMIRK